MRILTRYAISLLSTSAVPLLAAGCAQNFAEAKTPSGTYCTDMLLFLNGQPGPDRPFHRIKPIATPMKPLTASERQEALRVEACKIGGDAVLNAGDEDAQAPDHTMLVRSSGYAIRWTTNLNKGLSLHDAASATPPATPSPEPEAAAPAPALAPEAQSPAPPGKAAPKKKPVKPVAGTGG